MDILARYRAKKMQEGTWTPAEENGYNAHLESQGGGRFSKIDWGIEGDKYSDNPDARFGIRDVPQEMYKDWGDSGRRAATGGTEPEKVYTDADGMQPMHSTRYKIDALKRKNRAAKEQRMSNRYIGTNTSYKDKYPMASGRHSAANPEQDPHYEGWGGPHLGTGGYRIITDDPESFPRFNSRPLEEGQSTMVREHRPGASTVPQQTAPFSPGMTTRDKIEYFKQRSREKRLNREKFDRSGKPGDPFTSVDDATIGGLPSDFGFHDDSASSRRPLKQGTFVAPGKGLRAHGRTGQRPVGPGAQKRFDKLDTQSADMVYNSGIQPQDFEEYEIPRGNFKSYSYPPMTREAGLDSDRDQAAVLDNLNARTERIKQKLSSLFGG